MFVWLCFVVACSAPPKREPEPTKPDAQLSTDAVMRHLLAEIERPGRQHEINADPFFARPDSLATLVSAYDASSGAWERWKLLRLARKTVRADVTAFLKAEALKPVPKMPATLGMAITVSNEEYVNRLEAALGVVDAIARQGTSDVEEIIRTVDISISRIVGVQLWSRDLLTDELIAALHARGLPTEYRAMSESEERTVMAIEPTKWRKGVQ